MERLPSKRPLAGDGFREKSGELNLILTAEMPSMLISI